MTIREEQRDLLTVPQGYYLAHCITGDCSLGIGIAKQINNAYNMREKLNKDYTYNDDYDLKGYVGEALLMGNVFNLVLKKEIDSKPKYKKLKKCLYDMKAQMEEYWITKLAIPRLGCGHEGLDWERVKEIIEEVFDDTDVEILVCSL